MTRQLLIVLVALTLSSPALARKKHRRAPRHRTLASAKVQPRAQAQVDRAKLPPRIDAGAEQARAQAELDELRNSRELPIASLGNQAEDDEIPGRPRR